MNTSEKVLVIGSGVAGMDATLMLSKAGKKVILVEKLALTGGKTIKNEETYPNLDCSTCLVAPIQQEILQDPNIELLTLSTVEKVDGDEGSFKVIINKIARYINAEACLGCHMCYDPCPVVIKNEWEEDLIDRKAVYIPCTGALPNVPRVQAEHCLKLNGKDESCNKCVEACMFAAFDFNQKDEKIEVEVSGIIVATGYELLDVAGIEELGYGKYSGVYTALEFERLFASNGPTEGALTLRSSDKSPKTVAIVHCVGRDKVGYCSSICCMSSSKHAHFIKHKLPDAKIYNIYSDLCLADKTYQKFNEKVSNESSEFIFQADRNKMKITETGDKLSVSYINKEEKENSLTVDMVVLASALVPPENIEELTKILDIERDEYGFIAVESYKIGSVETSRPGIFVAGCAEGPKDIQGSVLQAQAAVAGILSIPVE
ncbi:MAG: CoB--CoM heterodisulfide reductase iron-sulfur subunit A family protein [Candidatus Delongbacteria bacterium]|nr:CoB--CoM heterodisulfide reductase iron-sulfur subunit A family protein [Candidatus Delongbacteria bacterium]